VQVSYPCDENAVEATQQLAGNLFSAMLVPLCQMASNYDLQLARSSFDIRGDTIILLAIMLTTAAAFSTSCSASCSSQRRLSAIGVLC